MQPHTITNNQPSVALGIVDQWGDYWKSVIQRGGTGNYLAAVYKDGKIAGSCEFEIYDKSKESEKTRAVIQIR